MALYRLKVFLANGNDITPYAECIMEEMKESFRNGLNARNPKELKNNRFDEAESCIVAEIYSKAELSSPGHLLSNVSKSLLKSEDVICKKLGTELLGNRLFRIDSEEVDVPAEMATANISDCRFLQIIASLLLEEVDVKERHQNEELIRELKNVLVQNPYIVSKFGLEE